MPRFGSRRVKVLIVEDDDDTASFLLEGLRARGHEVEHAKTGREGLALALTARFDVMALSLVAPSRTRLKKGMTRSGG